MHKNIPFKHFCCVLLIGLQLSHPILWLKYEIELPENTVFVIECCCLPDECECEGHETSCGTIVSECFTLLWAG